MTSRKRPRLPLSDDGIYCQRCKIKFNNLLCLEIHCRGGHQPQKIGKLQPPETKDRLKDVIYNPGRMLALVGLQYVKKRISKKKNRPYYACTLCAHFDGLDSVVAHLGNLKHKRKYISRHFPILSKHVIDKPILIVEEVAKVVEEVEGFEMYKPTSSDSDVSSGQDVIDRVLEKLSNKGMLFEITHEDISTLSPGLRPAGTVHNECSEQLERTSPIGTCKQVSPMQTQSRERSQSSLPSAAPVSSSFASSSATFSLGYQTSKKGSSPIEQYTGPLYTGNLSQATGGNVCENSGIAQEYIPSDYGSFPYTLPSDYGSFPSTVRRGPSYQYVNNDGVRIHQTPLGYTHTIPDGIHSAYTAECRNWRQESAPTDVKDLVNQGEISRSRSSLSCPSGKSLNNYSEGSSSFYSGESVNGNLLHSKHPLPSKILTVLPEESNFSRSSGDTPLFRVSPSSSTISSRVPSSQAIDTSTTETKYSGLSPDILDILRGKDVPTVNSILNRLAEYYPPLQKVNISMLVDVLFESGAID